MTTLTEFLLARIAEDERDGWEVHIQGCPSVRDVPFPCDCGYPARVLAECEAKRRIVGLHAGQVENVEWFDAPKVGKAEVCPSCRPAEPTIWNPPVGQAGIRPDDFVASYVLSPCPTLRALALPYADHPDYREEWRP